MTTKITTANISDDAITTAKLADTVTLGRRNIIINGAMQVAQRGTSETGITNGNSFVIDRFQMQNNAAYTSDVEQETLTSGGAFDAGFKKALKVTWTTAADNSTGNYSLTNYNIEKQDMDYLLQGTSNAKNIVISFWVKSSVTGNHAVTMQNYASSRRSNVLSYNISAANTWEYKTIATSVDTTASTQSDTGKGISLRFGHAAGTDYEESTSTGGWVTEDSFGFTGAAYPGETTNATWHITGIQIEKGTEATSFEHRSYAEELALCQRYFQIMFSKGEDFHAMAMANLSNTDYSNALMLPHEMRAAPTATRVGSPVNTSGGSVGTNSWAIYYSAGWKGCQSLTVTEISNTSFRIDTQPNNSGGQGGSCGLYGGTGCYFEFEAEL